MRTVYTVDITVYDPAMYGTKTLYFAAHGIKYGGNYYEPRLKQPGNFQTNLWGDGTTRGASRVGFGEIVLINNDGGLDSFAYYGLDGRTIVLRKIVLGVATILMSCSMEQPVPTWDTVPIRIKDKQQLLTVPVQPTKYGGTNVLPGGVDGTADIQGRPKPILLGNVGAQFGNGNPTPVCVNTSRLIYQCHESALQDIPAVYDKGVSLTRGTDYASAAEVQSSPPDPGTYRAYLAGGMFRLGSSPAGQVTFDGVEGATAANRTAAQIAKRLALRGITSDEIDAADVTALDALNSAEVGIYISGEQSIAAGIDEVLGSIGAWYAFDSVGVLNMGSLDAPAGEPVATLTSAEILVIDRKATNDSGRGVPPHKVNLGYAKNYTVQDAGSLAGRVTSQWINHDLPSTASWKSIVHGNGLFVAIASGGTVAATSPDGETWTARTLPTSTTWESVTYGNGTFVAISYNSAIAATSPDGITWTQRAMPVSAYWKAVTYGNGVFVAVSMSASNKAATSPDGITWTQRTLPQSTDWYGVTYGNGVFVAVAYNVPYCATSTDGTTWTQRTLPVSAFWYGVAYGNGLFVAIAGDGTAATSPDGITWTQRALPSATSWYSIAYGDGLFMAVCTSGNVTALSADGITWTQIAIPTSPAWFDVAYGNGSFVSIAFTGGTSSVYRISPSTEHALFVSKEYRTVSASDASILTKHPTAGELNINTLLAYAADATTEAERQLVLRGTDRDYLSVKVKSSVLPADILGKTVMIRVSRYGYDVGKLFTVVGATYDYALNSTVIEIWG